MTLEGVAVRLGQVPAPSPVALTVTVAVAVESVVSTMLIVVGEVKLADAERWIVSVRRAVIVAFTLVLLEVTLNGPVPPEIVTVFAVQSVSVTLEGLVVRRGQAPAPSPVRLTVTFATDVPSDTPTVNGPAVAGDGLLRRIVTKFPAIETVSASLPELTK